MPTQTCVCSMHVVHTNRGLENDPKTQIRKVWLLMFAPNRLGIAGLYFSCYVSFFERRVYFSLTVAVSACACSRNLCPTRETSNPLSGLRAYRHTLIHEYCCHSWASSYCLSPLLVAIINALRFTYHYKIDHCLYRVVDLTQRHGGSHNALWKDHTGPWLTEGRDGVG